MADLLEGENLVFKIHRHWILVLKALWVPILLVALVILGLDLLLQRQLLPDDAKVAVTLAVLATAGAWAIVAWIQWTANSFTLTDQRVILDAGFFNRSSKVIALDRVQDVSTRQSIPARMLGYGTVEIDSAGPSGAELLDHVPGPNHFRDQVFVQAERLRHTPRPVE